MFFALCIYYIFVIESHINTRYLHSYYEEASEFIWGDFNMASQNKKILETKVLEENGGLLDEILVNLPVIFYGVNKDGIFTKSEGAGLKRLGLKNHQAIGLNVFESWPEFTEIFERALKGETIRFESQGEANGQMWSFLTYLFPDKQTGSGIIGFAIDLTERELLKNKLVRSEAKYRSLIEQASDGIAIINENKLILFNPKFAEMLGYTVEELLSSTHIDVLHPDEKAQIKGRQQERLDGKPVKSIYETKLIKKNGDSLNVEFNVGLIDYEEEKSILVFVRDISDRKEAERLIKESQEKYRLIIETAQEGIWLVDQEEKITYANQQLSEMIGYSIENMINHSIFDFIMSNKHDKARLMIQRLRKGLKKNFDFQFHRRDGTVFWGLVNTNPIFDDNGKYSGTLGSVLDITERKQREEQTRKKLRKYNVEEGYVYLISESSPILSISVFEDLCKLGFECLVLSRTIEKDFKKNLKSDCNFLWLAQKGKENHIHPQLEIISSKIESMHQKSTILIDRLDYLIQKNGFNHTINFVYELKELANILDLIILITLDPRTLSDQEFLLLEKETRTIEPRSLEKIPADKLEILRFVYNKNQSGIKPAYSDIGIEFTISRPTTRKRIKTLVATGYLAEYRFGIRKVLEVTEKGRMLFVG
jgi:PAS domain S-box-containing protein